MGCETMFVVIVVSICFCSLDALYVPGHTVKGPSDVSYLWGIHLKDQKESKALSGRSGLSSQQPPTPGQLSAGSTRMKSDSEAKEKKEKGNEAWGDVLRLAAADAMELMQGPTTPPPSVDQQLKTAFSKLLTRGLTSYGGDGAARGLAKSDEDPATSLLASAMLGSVGQSAIQSMLNSGSDAGNGMKKTFGNVEKRDLKPVLQSAISDLVYNAVRNPPNTENFWYEMASQALSADSSPETEVATDASYWSLVQQSIGALNYFQETTTQRPESLWKMAALDLLSQVEIEPVSLPPPASWPSLFWPANLSQIMDDPQKSIDQVKTAATLLKTSGQWVRFLVPKNDNNTSEIDTEEEEGWSTYLMSDGWLTLWEPSTTTKNKALESGSYYDWFYSSSAEPTPSTASAQPATANESGWGVNFWPSSSQPEDIALQSSPVTDGETQNMSWSWSWFQDGDDTSAVSEEHVTPHIPFCTEPKSFLCPNLKDEFHVPVCCNSHWIAKKVSLETRDVCMIDLNEMERQCEIRTCYKSPNSTVPGKWDTDGCSSAPDYMLSYESCVLHDLCYITKETTKEECDKALEQNINKIYCDNMNDSWSCYFRSHAASVASFILSQTDRYYILSNQTRQTCPVEDGFFAATWKYVLRSSNSIVN